MYRRLVGGVLLFLLAAVAIIARREWVAHIRLTPVKMPVPTSVSAYSTGDFRIDVSYLYEIEIRFHIKNPDPITDCLIGIEAESQSCGDRTPLLQGKWKVYDAKRTALAEGIVKPGGYRDSLGISRTLGSFYAKAGQIYRVDLENSKDITALASTSPTLIVHPHREFNTDWGATYYYVEPVAIVCAIVGAYFVAAALLTARSQSAPSTHNN